MQRKSEKMEENSASDKESRENLVKRMEELQIKHNALKHDLQRLLDEKEDIVREKEDMSLKVIEFIFSDILFIFIYILRFTE